MHYKFIIYYFGTSSKTVIPNLIDIFDFPTSVFPPLNDEDLQVAVGFLLYLAISSSGEGYFWFKKVWETLSMLPPF